MTDIKKYNSMTVVIIAASGIFYGIGRYTEAAGSGAWMLALIYTFLGVGLYTLLFDDKAAESFAESSGWMRKLFAVTLTTGGIFYASALTAYIADNITVAFLNRTPVQYILVLLVIPGAVGCWFGTRSVARYALPVAAGAITVVVLLFCMCIGEYSGDNLYPLLGRGLSGVYKGIAGMSVFAPVLFYYVILSGCKYKNARRNIAKIIFLSGLTVTVVCLGINLLLPYPGAEATSMPLYTLGASVRGNYLIERSESVVLILWLFCAYISVGSITAVTSEACMTVFELDNRQALTGAFCSCVLVSGLIVCAFDLEEKAISLSSSILGIMSVAVPLAVNIRHRFVR